MKKNTRTIFAWALIAILACFIAAELVSRFALGLGDPPLFKLDPEIEYLALPDRDYSRFGNDISYNAYSMRADQFPQMKSSSEELRIIVIGDSVINGGSRIDQRELATELLKERLQARLKQPVVIGNISASSWGPANQLAYMRRFGLFDADLVILVTHSQDVDDEPTFDSVLGVSQPMAAHPPTLASYELIVRYGPRALEPIFGSSESTDSDLPEGTGLQFTTRPVMDQIAAYVLKTGTDLGILYHIRRKELPLPPNSAENGLKSFSSDHDLLIRTTTERYTQLKEAGKSLYQDDIHLNAEGQIALADELEALILTWLRTETQPSVEDVAEDASPAED